MLLINNLSNNLYSKYYFTYTTLNNTNLITSAYKYIFVLFL